ncbi:O-succinylhomoserine sulfhydrylase [Rhodospirillaceae bacterium LM-1]|nr:O-succinylhomoserine sulfhydrylase [Rhodospirillaceae bacterium LM-1]
MSKNEQNWGPNTRLVRAGLHRSQFEETSEAMYLTSGYVYQSAEEAEAAFVNDGSRYVYGRFGNPTITLFEERLAALEGAEACKGVASGMAAVFASIACQVRAGDRLVAPRALFGSCTYILNDLMSRFGVACDFVDGTDLAQWEQALSKPAKAVFVETPSNPSLELVDLKAVAGLCKKAGARLIVDNVFATPLFQKPLQLGADIVVYSATKHIDGQGRCLGGAVLGSKEFIAGELAPFLRHTGPALSPFNAWTLAKGLETLALRVERQAASALSLAHLLEGHVKIASVRHPGLASHPQHELAKRQMSGFGTMLGIEIKGGQAAAFRFLNALEMIDISNNLGDAKSLITHPATTTHQRLTPEDKQRQGIAPGLLRLSVGLEDEKDLKADLMRGLAAV